MPIYYRWLCICFAVILSLFIVKEVSANTIIENFANYDTGDITVNPLWSATGTAEGIVQNNNAYGYPNALKFDSDNNWLFEYLEYSWTDDEVNPILSFAIYLEDGADDVCMQQVNASSTIFSWICFEDDMGVDVNGMSGRNFWYDDWLVIQWQVSTTADEARIKVGTSSWSSWRAYGVSDKDLATLRFTKATDSTHDVYFDSLAISDDTEDYESVEVITLPDWRGNVSIESDERIQFDYENFCTIGYDCRIWFNYNPSLVNHTIYLTENTDAARTDIDNAIDSQGLVGGLLLQDYFMPTSRTEPITDNYCLYDQHPDLDTNLDTIYCDVKVTWSHESTILNDYFSEYDCDTICDGVATGTDWFNFRYGIECGTRKLLCWGFVPSDETLIKFAKSVYTVENAFPFTIFTQLKDTIQEKSFSATNTQLTVNFTDLMGIEGFDNDLPLLEQDMMSDTFGTLWDRIYSLMEYFIYIAGFIFLVYEIVKFNKRKLG